MRSIEGDFILSLTVGIHKRVAGWYFDGHIFMSDFGQADIMIEELAKKNE